MLASEVGWEDTDYVFTCIKYSDMLDDLKSSNGSCSMSAAGGSSNRCSIRLICYHRINCCTYIVA
jgi:hypothetical protein